MKLFKKWFKENMHREPDLNTVEDLAAVQAWLGQQKRIDELENVLRFYGFHSSYTVPASAETRLTPVDIDGGAKARKALKKENKNEM